MISVKLPDGSTAQFPDGTPNDVMVKAIQQKFPPQQTAAAQPPAAAIPAAPQPYAQTIPAQALSGVNEGLAGVLGFPVDATQMALRAGAAGVHALGGPDIQLPENALGGSQTFKDMMGQTIAPPTQDAGGQMARRIGADVGAAIMPGMGAIATSSRPLATAAMNLGTSLLSGTGAAVADQVAPDNKYADLAGEMAGGLAGGGLMGAAKRLITPFPSSPERAAMVDTMKANGVDLTAGQQTGSNGLKYAESELGGNRAQNLTDQQRQQFTSAALSRAGVSADRATPEVIDGAFTDLGGQFDRLAQNNRLIPDKQMGTDIAAAVNGYKNLKAESQQAPAVNNAISDIINFARSGQITGPQYADLRSNLNSSARAVAQSDHPLSEALFGIQGALDGAMERSIAQNNPADLGEWRQARTDYKNLLVIANAAKGAGEASAMGLISPAKLRQAAVAQNARGYVRGRGDFADLARAGEATMTPLPQSGTAPRMAARALGTGPLAIAGALLGQHAGGDVLSGLAGAAAGAAVPRVVGRAMMSKLGQRYLANQLIGGGGAVPNGMVGPLAAALIHQAGAQ